MATSSLTDSTDLMFVIVLTRGQHVGGLRQGTTLSELPVCRIVLESQALEIRSLRQLKLVYTMSSLVIHAICKFHGRSAAAVTAVLSTG